MPDRAPTSSDLVGAIHRNMMEVVVYLNQSSSLDVNPDLVRRHLAHAADLLDALSAIQGAMSSNDAENGVDTARAN